MILLVKSNFPLGNWKKFIPETWKEENSISVPEMKKKEDLGNDRPVILTLTPVKDSKVI